ncbi:MAG: hypothetical protein ACI9T9_001932 [Oleiphilaceae bacterium]|jgi:hypothetical protein
MNPFILTQYLTDTGTKETSGGNQSYKQGLDLAIVKRLAYWHQAELTIGKSDKLGGAEIAVRVMLAR